MVTNIDIDEINAAFRDAQALHKAGDVQAAAARYEALRPKIPDQPELLYLLGAAYVHLEQPSKAVPLLERSLTLRPDYVPAVEMAGSAWIKLQVPAAALPYFERAAALRSESYEALCRLGTTLNACARYGEACAVFQHARTIDQNHPHAMSGEAQALHGVGQTDDAETLLWQCIDLNPLHEKGYTILAALLGEAERFSEAEQILLQYLDKNPGQAEVQHLLAITWHRQGRLVEAERMYRQVLEATSPTVTIFEQLGDVLADLGQLDEAETIQARALGMFPDEPALLTGLGRIEELRGNLERAMELHDRSIAIEPRHVNALINRGTARRYAGDFKGALADYDAAIALNPNLPAPAANRGMTLLTLGRLDEGWPDFRARIKARAGSIDLSGSAVWDKKPLDGKTVLVWTEYGLGDEILFSSLLPELISITGTCTVACSPRLTALLRRSFPAAIVRPLGEPIEGEFDVRLPLTDVAQLLRPSLESFPGHNAYLNADASLTEQLRMRYREMAGDRRVVGLSWHSKGGIGTAPFKSIPIKQWRQILEVPELNFVSLQYGDWEREIHTVKDTLGINIHVDSSVDSSGDLDMFAAQVAAMDLVISISNTTVHMAGAIGVPVWAMVPTGPGAHWYWFRDRTDSPWYPSLRIFRQARPGDWSNAVADVAAKLNQWRQE